MTSLLAWLLKPSNLLIVALSVALGLTWLVADARKHKVMGLEKEAEICKGTVAAQAEDIISLNSIIEKLKANLEAIKKSAAAMQKVAAEAVDLRKRIHELQSTPNASCEKLQVEYEKVASGITGMFMYRVRGKVNSPDAPGDPGSPKVLPGPGAPGARLSDFDAGTAR